MPASTCFCAALKRLIARGNPGSRGEDGESFAFGGTCDLGSRPCPRRDDTVLAQLRPHRVGAAR